MASTSINSLIRPISHSTPDSIAYTSSPLYCLTGASYSGGYTYTFAYRYDAVGNRTAMTKTITSTLVTTYTYDAANRLINAGGVAHTWDNNGNLLNDGSRVYAYDVANRLISTTLSGVNTQFGYNGDGIRLRLIEAGALTTYTQDYAAPLPVVLHAKTGTVSTQYMYSLGTRPLAEYEAVTWEYLLPDPLGSVRQIADASGNVTLLKSYEPYGSVLNSQGSAASTFAYAGEQVDTTGLVFLRARYIQPRLGMFLSHDPWEGDMLRPESMNGWNYVEGNPIRFVDPTGLVPRLAEILTENHQYSCNCGWIDWSHAAPDIARTTIQGVNEAQRITSNGVVFPVRLDELAGGYVLGGFWVDTSLGEDSLLSRRVALGVYQSFHNFYEKFQAGYGNLFRGLANLVTTSSFSEEDLTSDLIGFYRAVWENTGLPGIGQLDARQSREKVAELCRVVGLADDMQTRIRKQAEIFARYQLPPTNGFRDVYEWGNPRLADLSSTPGMSSLGWDYNGNRIIDFDTEPQAASWKDVGVCWPSYCTEPNRRFPSEFQQITPIQSGTLWRWTGAISYALGQSHYYSADELNR